MSLIPPNGVQQKRMNEELYQDERITARDVEFLRAWLSKQPHLPNHMDVTRLARFLYGCKYSLERTKRMLDTYYTVRANVPEFFANRDPTSREMQLSFDHVSYFLLPNLTPEGYRVTILRLNSTDIEHFEVQTLVKRIVMTLDARLLQEHCLNNVMVIDLHGFTLPHYVQCLPATTLIRKAMLCIQDAFPLRLACIHFLNTPAFIGSVHKLFTPLLKEKLLQKFLFHTGGGEYLQHFMPREILPLEYGGNAGSFQELNDSWRCRVESLRTWYAEEELKSKADEARRPTVNQKQALNDGSFRQLAID